MQDYLKTVKFVTGLEYDTYLDFKDALYGSEGDLWLNAGKITKAKPLPGLLLFARVIGTLHLNKGFGFVTKLMIKRHFSKQFGTCPPRLPLELARPVRLLHQNPRLQQPYLCF